ncbi:MAG: hypothetical protein ACI857_000219 [Arenicella sp.]|jgi:hypothetical protein
MLKGFAILALCISQFSFSQDSTFHKTKLDTSKGSMNMDATYDRPFLSYKNVPVAVGGYLEANTRYALADGITDGLSFQARRFTLFLSSSIKNRLKFLAEIEFEDGTKEIAIEFAALDLSINPLLNFRGGIVMNPIGAFNQNHDGPKWEFIDRPIVSVQMLPATWSNAGFGLYGKTAKNNWIFGYELYLTNGFNGNIIDNEENKTFLPAAKEDDLRFEESSNGQPLYTGKIAIKNRKLGEIGFSYMGGIYNHFEIEGITLDSKRRLDVMAFDINFDLPKIGTTVIGEIAFIGLDIPDTYSEQFGKNQWGGFVDIIQPVWHPKVFNWKDAVLNVNFRTEFADWNVGTFSGTTLDIGEDVFAITPGVSFRPSAQTVFRLNYQYQWQTDILNNPSARTATWLVGISTYF